MSLKSPLEGKNIWIVGGAGHLGAPLTEALDSARARTVCFDLGDRAAALVREKKLTRTVAETLDAADAAALPARVEALTARHGVPDGLLYLAFASSSGKSLEQLAAEDFRGTLDRSLTPAFVLCRALAERMRPRGSGSVVLFASMYGVVSPDPRIYRAPMAPNPVDYGAAKAALLHLTRYLAVHYGPSGIRFNCVTPGPFPNPGVQERQPEFIADLARKVPLGRIGRPEEIVGPALFLLSDGASYVTGHSLAVDGGWTLW